MTSPTSSVSGLDLYPIARDAVSRGYLSNSCYLIDVEAGFELWQGGTGLATNSFAVDVGGSGSPSSSSPSASPSSSASVSSSPTPPPTGGGGSGAGCTAAYAITNLWSGGFQGQVTVTAGASAITGWKVAWDYPGAETLNELWNGSYTQSGDAVMVSNLSYDGSLAAGTSTTFGFTGTDTGSAAAPGPLACTATG